MKKEIIIYDRPRIKAIKIKSEQCVLQVCKVGGEYMPERNTYCSIATTSMFGSQCLYSPKGAHDPRGGMYLWEPWMRPS